MKERTFYMVRDARRVKTRGDLHPSLRFLFWIVVLPLLLWKVDHFPAFGSYTENFHRYLQDLLLQERWNFLLLYQINLFEKIYLWLIFKNSDFIFSESEKRMKIWYNVTQTDSCFWIANLKQNHYQKII